MNTYIYYETHTRYLTTFIINTQTMSREYAKKYALHNQHDKNNENKYKGYIKLINENSTDDNNNIIINSFKKPSVNYYFRNIQHLIYHMFRAQYYRECNVNQNFNQNFKPSMFNNQIQLKISKPSNAKETEIIEYPNFYIDILFTLLYSFNTDDFEKIFVKQHNESNNIVILITRNFVLRNYPFPINAIIKKIIYEEKPRALHA